MIVFDLACSHGHRFEGWFASSAAFADQQVRSLLVCPECGSAKVDKAPMTPAVPRKGNQRVEPQNRPMANRPLPPEAAEAIARLARLQAEALKHSRHVGDNFAEDVRAMHYGERAEEPIHGNASLEQARDLLDEGIAVAPLPFPVVQDEEKH